MIGPGRDSRIGTKLLILVVVSVTLSTGGAAAFSCDSGSLSGTCNVTTSQGIANGTTISGTGNLVIESTGSLYNNSNLADIDIDMGGEVILKNNSNITGNVNITAANITIENKAVINSSELGFKGAKTGRSTGNGPGAGQEGDGAGYGGKGGFGGGSDSTDEGGLTYGDRSYPTSFGSGGGSGEGDNDPGGNGGGRILLNASKNVTVDGKVIAEGGRGSDDCCGGPAGGGGSGGSILIDASKLTGTGTLSVKGGKGGDKGNNGNSGGGGAGGRIGLVYSSESFTGTTDISAGDTSTLYNSRKGFTGSLYPSSYSCDDGTTDSHCIINSTKEEAFKTLEGTGNLTIGANATINAPNRVEFSLNFSEILIKSNATLKGNFNITADNLTVEENASIDAKGKGYKGGITKSNGCKDTIIGPGGGNGCAGGGYGGEGGESYYGNNGGSVYGSKKKPLAFGSGGGSGWEFLGGDGGGRLIIEVDNNAVLNGNITANGGEGECKGCDSGDDGWGGGSGGSVFINASNITGNPILETEGNPGYLGGNEHGAGGGGGRIAIYYDTSTLNPSVSAAGGTSKTQSRDPPAQGGFDGTFYSENQSMICDSGTLSETCTLNSTTGFQNLSGTGKAVLGSNFHMATARLETVHFNFSEFVMKNGSEFYGNLNVTADNITVEKNAVIDASGKGYRPGAGAASAEGPGAGNSDQNGSSGAGHGYAGADGLSTEGGSSYGSRSSPLTFGSGGGQGGYTFGGTGGGRILLNSTNNLDLNGNVTAEGVNGGDDCGGNPCSTSGGGGSGGSLYLLADEITGSGLIDASGGEGGGRGGGGGSGGRIAFDTSTENFEGNISNLGGDGELSASSGTVYPHSAVCSSGSTSGTCGVNEIVSTSNLTGSGTLEIKNNGVMKSLDVLSLNFEKIVVKTGGTLKGNINITTDNLTVQEGAKVTASELGYPGGGLPGGPYYGWGPGRGGETGSNGGAGGGYGGTGGDGESSSGLGGSSYGSIYTPENIGSGGSSGGGDGGFGGGRIKIDSNYSLLNGNLTANGQDGFDSNAGGGCGSSGGGGGSGGSILLNSDQTEGSGLLIASGGDGNNGGGDSCSSGGGGAGGRIGIFADSSNANIDIEVEGGYGDESATNGTIGTYRSPINFTVTNSTPDPNQEINLTGNLFGEIGDLYDYNGINSVSIFYNNQAQVNSSINSTEQFNETLTSPKEQGDYSLSVNLSSANKLAGFSDIGLRVRRLFLNKPDSNFNSTDTNYQDIDDTSGDTTVNLTVKVFRSIDHSIDEVEALVTGPDSSTNTYYLNNTTLKNQTGIWYNTVNISDDFGNTKGEYKVNYTANTTAGNASLERTSEFNIQNISINSDLSDYNVNLGEEVNISGSSDIEPSDDVNDKSSLTFYRENETGSLISLGNENQNFTQPGAWNDHPADRLESEEFGFEGEDSLELGGNWKKERGSKLRLWYTMDAIDVSDTDSDDEYEEIYDRSGSGNNGTIGGNISEPGLTSRNGTALTFDGKFDEIDMDNTGISGDETRAMAGWFKTENLSQQKLTPLFGYGGSNQDESFDIAFEDDICSNNGLQLELYINQYCLKDNIQTGWHFVAASYNGTHIETYYDGEKTLEFQKSSLSTVDNFRIADRDDQYGDFFEGSLDDIQVYNKSLDQDEMMEIYHSKYNGTYNTSWKTYSFETKNLYIKNANYSLNGQSINLTVQSDYDSDGNVEENSSEISLDGDSIYNVGKFDVANDRYRVFIELHSDNVSRSPVLNGLDLVAGEITNQSGKYKKEFEAQKEPGNYTIKVNTTNRNGISGLNSTQISVFNLTNRIDAYPKNVFKDGNDLADYEFNDTLISDGENPGNLKNIKYRYTVPNSWSLETRSGVDTNGKKTISSLSNGTNTSFNVKADIGADAELGAHNIILNSSSKNDINSNAPRDRFFDFEDGELGDWKNISSLFEIKTDNTLDEYSAGVDTTNDPGENISYVDISEGRQERITSLEFYWHEEGRSQGGKIEVQDGENQTEGGFATNNPEWEIRKSDGTYNQIYSGDGTDRWIKVEFDFFYSNETYSYRIEDLQSGHVEIGYENLARGNAIEKLMVRNHGGNRMQMWFDDISVERKNFVNVWTLSNSTLNTKDVESPIPRSQNYKQIYSTIYDDVNSSKLEGINTTFTLKRQKDGGGTETLLTKHVDSNSSGISKFNWSVEEYGIGKYFVTTITNDEPEKYINSTDSSETTNYFNVTGVFVKEDNSLQHDTIWRNDFGDTAGEPTTSNIYVEFNNSIGNASQIEGATTEWQFPDQNITADLKSDGFTDVKTYNPSGTVTPGNYTVNVSVSKEDYETFTFNYTVELRGELQVENDYNKTTGREIITRGISQDLNSTVEDGNGDSVDTNMNWTLNGTIVATGQNTDEAIDNVTIGNDTLKAEAYKEYWDSASEEINVTVYGLAEINNLYPPSTTILPGTSINVTADVVDANTPNSVKDMPVTFSVNGTQKSRNLTNSTGNASFTWSPSNGVYNLSASINSNKSILYNTSKRLRTSTVEIDKELYIEDFNISEDRVYRYDDSRYSPLKTNVEVLVEETSENSKSQPASGIELIFTVNNTDNTTCTTDSNGKCNFDLNPDDAEPGEDEFKIETNDTNYETDIANTSIEIVGLLGGTPSAEHVIEKPGSGDTVLRGDTVDISFSMVRSDGEKVNVPVNWSFAGSDLSLSDKSGSFSVAVEENLGTQTLKAEAFTDYYYEDADSDSIDLQVYGKASTTLESPSNSTKVGYGETPEVLCSVQDQNGDDINNYPVEFFQNSTSLANKTTDLNGEVTHEWDVPDNIATYEVGCEIGHNDTLNYRGTTNISSKLYETKDDVAPEVENLSVNPEELKPGEDVDINFTVSDEVAIDDVWIEIKDPFFAKETIDVTNNSGVFETTYTTDSSAKGTYTVKAKANDTNGNVGTNTTTFKTSKDAQLSFDPSSFSAGNVRINENQSYNTTVNLTADANLSYVNISTNVSSDYDSLINYNTTPKECGNISKGGSCAKNFTITVVEAVSPQTVFVGFKGNWVNTTSGNESFVRKSQTLKIEENPVMEASPSSQFTDNLVAANNSDNSTIDVENLGNYDVLEFRTDFNSTNISDSDLKFYGGSASKIPSSSSTTKRTQTVTAQLDIPYGMTPQNYTANVSFTGDQSSENATLKYRVDTYRDFNNTPKFKEPVVVVDTQEKIGTVDIRSLSNVDIDVTGDQTEQTDTEVGNNLNTSFPTSAGIKPLETYEFPIWTVPEGIQSTGTYRLQYEFDTSQGTVSSKTTTFDVEVVNLSTTVYSDKTTEDIDIKSATDDSIKFEVKEGSQTRTENLSFNVKLENSSESISGEADIIDETEDGNFTLDYSFPDLEDARVYDLVLEVNDSDLGVDLEKRINDKYRYEDVTKPSFDRVDVSDVFTGNSVDVNITTSDNNLGGVENVTYEVEFPSSTKTFDLNRSGEFWTGSFSPPDSEGDYKGTLEATDAAGLKETNTEYFRVGEQNEFKGRFEKPDGSLIPANLTLKDPETGETIDELDIGSNSQYSFDIVSGRYDVEVKSEDNKVTLKNANISGENKIKISELTASEAPSPESKAKIMGIGVDQSADPDSGEITFNYSEFEDNIPSDEGITDVEIGRCKDFNYSEITCEGSWTKVNDSKYSTDKGDKTVSATVPGFSVYTLYFPEETNEELEEIQESVSQTQSSVGGLSGNLTSLQQQLENATSGGTNAATGAATQSGLELGSQEINAEIQPGQTKNVALSLSNNFDTQQEFQFSASTAIGQYLTLPESVTLQSGETKTINIEVSAGPNVEPSAYSGYLNIESSEVDNQIPVNIDIAPPDKELLDLSINPVFSSVEPGETAKVETTLSNQGYTRNVDVALRLSLVDSESNETLATNEKTVAVGTSLTRVLKLRIPNDAELKQYELRGSARYSNLDVSRVATAVSNLNVQKPFWERMIFGTLTYGQTAIAFVLLTIATATGYGIYQWHRKKIMAKKRYMEQIDLDTIPSGGPRQGFIGELAEMGTRTFVDLDDLTTHAIIAGATGSGKTVTGQDIVEEALKEGVNVVVLDPTAQWSGYLRECKEDGMLNLYDKYNMSRSDTRSFNGNIRAVDPDQDTIDITPYLQTDDEEAEGEIIVFSMHKLDNADMDSFISDTIKQVFDYNCKEANELNTLIVYDEAHRILEKFGGSGQGLDQVERGAREFRKWGIGMILLSQVVSDFPGEVRANVGTTIQMRTQYEGDLNRLKEKFGIDTVQSVAKAEVGSGMLQNSDYNHGRPYFVDFRPMLHSPHRLSDEKLDKYEDYNRRIQELEDRIDAMEAEGQEVYELRSQLKLTKKNLRKGSFNLVDIYIEELEEDLE